MTENNKRANSIGMFDLSRGFLMIAVVLGHSITQFIKYWEPEYTMHWWYCFLILFKPIIYGVIPMFFIMSGYGFRKKKISGCIKERFRYLGKPYIYTAIVITIIILIKSMIKGESPSGALWYQTFPFILGLCPGEFQLGSHYIGSIGPIWFLMVLIIGWIVLDLIFYLENEALRAICVVMLSAFCTRLPFKSFIPFCIVQSLCCTTYLYFGYIMKKKKMLNQPLSRQSIIVLCTISFLVMIFGNIEVSQNVWALGMLDFFASGIVGFLLLKLFVKLNDGKYQGRIINAVRVIGKYSLYILCIHTIEYLVFPWAEITKSLTNHKIIGIVTVFVLRSIIIAAGCMIINRYVNMKIQRRRKNVKKP